MPPIKWWWLLLVAIWCSVLPVSLPIPEILSNSYLSPMYVHQKFVYWFRITLLQNLRFQVPVHPWLEVYLVKYWSDAGIWSGFVLTTGTENAAAATTTSSSNSGSGSFGYKRQNNAPTFTVTVNDTNPAFFYCAQIGHCQLGMVFAINPSVWIPLHMCTENSQTKQSLLINLLLRMQILLSPMKRLQEVSCQLLAPPVLPLPHHLRHRKLLRQVPLEILLTLCCWLEHWWHFWFKSKI